MIPINRFQSTKKSILEMPRDEQSVLLLAGHAANQLNIVIKLINLSANHPTDMEIADKLSAAQTHTLIRLLYGTLGETLEWIKRPGPQRLIGTKYVDRLPTVAQEAYSRLKRLWGHKNIIHYLRNNYAFHFPSDEQILDGAKRVPENEDWSLYAAPENTNSLYLVSELAVGYGSLSAISEQHEDSFSTMLKDVVLVANDLSTFLGCLIALITQEDLDGKLEQSLIRVHGAPSAAGSFIAFFYEEETGDQSL